MNEKQGELIGWTDVAPVGPSAVQDLNPRSSSIAESLRRIDWAFPGRKSTALEVIHPYPARFVGDIPGCLLDELPVPSGTAVFDPFCGSGTTLSEAQRRGLPSIGVDLNPIACLISRVRTSSTPRSLQADCVRVVREAKLKAATERREIPNVDHWFSSDVQMAVSGILTAIDPIDDPLLKDALRLALSSILVRVSNQESDTRYAAIRKNVSAEHVYGLFIAAVRKLDEALASRAYALKPATVLEADVLQLKPNGLSVPIGMVITSPPYPNAYEYWLYHKYRMFWLGFDPLAVKEREIGARAHFFKRRHHTEEHFVHQMSQTFTLIDAVLVKSGYVCFVVGRSKIHGRIVDNARIVADCATNRGFREVVTISRSIEASRKSFNLAHANIKTESILVFQK